MPETSDLRSSAISKMLDKAINVKNLSLYSLTFSYIHLIHFLPPEDC